MSDVHVILASASPRRTQLLAEIGVAHEVHAVETDETLSADQLLDPAQACMTLSTRKAQASLEDYLSQPRPAGVYVFVGSDTMVVEGGEIFGKPKDDADAHRMLRRLSGVTHQVMTAVALLRANVDAAGENAVDQEVFVDISPVTFHELSDQDIADYLACGESYDKAGAYAVQGIGARLVKQVEGNLDTVIGLPAQRLRQEYASWLGL